MTKDEALKLAIEAFYGFIPYLPLNDEAQCGRYDKAITAIKEALAEPWEKFCDSNCVWTDHHPDCKLTEQEPVACVQYIPCCTDKTCSKFKATTPPQRKPLTDEEINEFFQGMEPNNGFWLSFARAIEAAHGIKGEA